MAQKKSKDLFKRNVRLSERHPLDNFTEEEEAPTTRNEMSREEEPMTYRRTTAPRQDPFEEEEDVDVRHSFIISSGDLGKIKDIVHFERSQGNYTYSQKDVLHDAIMALIQERGDVPKRPAEIMRREQERNQKIRRGKRK